MKLTKIFVKHGIYQLTYGVVKLKPLVGSPVIIEVGFVGRWNGPAVSLSDVKFCRRSAFQVQQTESEEQKACSGVGRH